MIKDSNSKIEKSPDDWRYMLSDSKGVITRVWAMPAEKKNFYNIYRLDRARDLWGFGYFMIYGWVSKYEVDKKIMGILKN